MRRTACEGLHAIEVLYKVIDALLAHRTRVVSVPWNTKSIFKDATFLALHSL